MVKPVEYVLSKEENRTFQYIPLFKSLLQILNQKEICDFIVHDSEAQSNSDSQYRAMSDGNYYKTNELFSAGHPSIAIILFFDGCKLLYVGLGLGVDG